ncbi:MAG TPA: hypothetical protein GYA07_05035 [Verrucomicrobia bacterium]|nr:hypothetical protein [Verrucomicrobiota bacterium]HOQ47883.1 hypothetical protein [Bryobacteraceae bacterium]
MTPETHPKEGEGSAALTAQEIHETLYDGVDVPVIHKDGRREVVKVRKVPRSQMAQYSMLIGGGDETAECAFYCDRDQAWANSLDDDSFDHVLEEGQRLNFTSFARWFERQARKLKVVEGQQQTLAMAADLMQSNPALRTLLGSTNGSSARGTETPISGRTAPQN